MRKKEGSSDYRYFPEPDLGPIHVPAAQRQAWQAELPELPAARRHRYGQELGLSEYDARVLTDERPMADYFEAAVAAGGNPKAMANWLMGDLSAYLNAHKLSAHQLPFTPRRLVELVGLVEANTISGKTAKELLPELLANGGSPMALVEKRGLTMVSDPAQLTALVEEVLAAHPKEVDQFRQGKTKLKGFFVGQLMKKTRGKADPRLANRILAQTLKA